jgi:hypothetical protein
LDCGIQILDFYIDINIDIDIAIDIAIESDSNIRILLKIVVCCRINPNGDGKQETNKAN